MGAKPKRKTYQSARGAKVRPALASWANAATAIRLRGKGWTSFSGTANPVKQAPLPERAGLLYGSAPDPATRRPLLERAGLPYGSAADPLTRPSSCTFLLDPMRRYCNVPRGTGYSNALKRTEGHTGRKRTPPPSSQNR